MKLIASMYFLTYESLIHTDTSKGVKREDIPEWKLCLYGALSGEAMWLAAYPIGMDKLYFESDSRCYQIANAD